MNPLNGKNIIKYAAIGSYLLSASCLWGNLNGDLFNAVQARDVGRINALIAAGADVNAKDRVDRRPLHRAAANGSLEVVRALIDAGAKVNAKRIYCHHTPLFYAAMNGHLEVVRTLIDAGAKVNVRVVVRNYYDGADRKTALDMALEGLKSDDLSKRQKYQAIVDLLREHGGSPDKEVKKQTSLGRRFLNGVWDSWIEPLPKKIIGIEVP